MTDTGLSRTRTAHGAPRHMLCLGSAPLAQARHRGDGVRARAVLRGVTALRPSVPGEADVLCSCEVGVLWEVSGWPFTLSPHRSCPST